MLSGFSSNRGADLARDELCEPALQLAPNDVEVLRNKAIVLRARDDLEEAGTSRKVIELAPAVGVGT